MMPNMSLYNNAFIQPNDIEHKNMFYSFVYTWWKVAVESMDTGNKQECLCFLPPLYRFIDNIGGNVIHTGYSSPKPISLDGIFNDERRYFLRRGRRAPTTTNYYTYQIQLINNEMCHLPEVHLQLKPQTGVHMVMSSDPALYHEKLAH